MKNRICFLCLLTGIVVFLLSACGAGEKSYTDYSQFLRPSTGNAGSPVQAPAPGDDFSSAVTIISTPLPATPAPVSTPSPTPVSGPFSSPASPSPSIQPTPVPNMVQITKSPTSETVTEGGSAVFIAYADNSTGIVWITVSPDAKSAYDITNAYTVFPSLQVSGQGTSVLTLSNIPYEMNGWRIQAYFNGNGGPLYTAGAYLTVIQAGGITPGGEPTPGGDSTEASCAALAKQAYSDVYYQASAAGFSVGSIVNYSYLNGKSDFNITLSNARWRIVGEFSSWYQTADSYGYGPVHAVVYDLAGNMQRSDHLDGSGMNAFYNIMQSYQ